MDNDRSLAESAVSLINEDNMDDVAIVVDKTSRLYNEVVSELYRRHLRFKNIMLPDNDPELRKYLEIIELSFRYHGIRVKDVRHLFSHCGYQIDPDFDEYYLDFVVSKEGCDKDLRKLCKMMENICEGSGAVKFSGVVDTVYGRNSMGDIGKTIRRFLNDTGMYDVRVNRKQWDILSFMANNVSDIGHVSPTPVDERTGVLIIDCLEGSFIDRDNIIFLGMGPEWSADFSKSIYITDCKGAESKDQTRFNVLIQQGTNRVYIAHKIRNGSDSTPCLYFREFLNEEEKKLKIISKFNDFAEVSSGTEIDIDAGNYRTVRDRNRESDYLSKKFSKSSYSDYCKCPYRFMFKTLSSPEKYTMKSGTIIHDFSEIYLSNHDEMVDEGIDELIDDTWRMHLKPLVSKSSEEFEKKRFKKKLQNNLRFIDEVVIPNLGKKLSKKQLKTNELCYTLDFDLYEFEKVKAETDLESEQHMMEGRADLIVLDELIWDYKTGTHKSAKKYLEDSCKYHDYQGLFYLKLLFEYTKNETIGFNLFYSNLIYNQSDVWSPERRTIRMKLIKDVKSYLKSDDCHIRTEFYKDEKMKINDSEWDMFVDGIDRIGIQTVSETAYNGNSDMIKSKFDNVKSLRDRYNKFKKFLVDGMIVDDNIILVPISKLEVVGEQINMDHETLSMMLIGENEMVSTDDSKICDKCDYSDICMRCQGGLE